MLIPQNEHARLAGVMAAAWRYTSVRPHGEVVRAIAQHDDGWIEFDKLPSINGSGEPRCFLEVPRPERYRIWAQSIELIAQRGMLYGACVVAKYFMNRAYDDKSMARLSAREAVALGNFLAEYERKVARWQTELEKRQTEVDAAASTNPNDTSFSGLQAIPPVENLADDVRLLEVCDELSILLCSDFTGTRVIENIPYSDGIERLVVTRPNGKFGLEIDPLPFRKALRDQVKAITIPLRAYTSQEELRKEFEAGTAVSQEFLLSGPTQSPNGGS